MSYNFHKTGKEPFDAKCDVEHGDEMMNPKQSDSKNWIGLRVDRAEDENCADEKFVKSPDVDDLDNQSVLTT